MSIMPSLGTATSGINAFQQGISVVSDNIANTDTTAFKENDILFREMINKFTGCPTGGFQVGEGVAVHGVRAPFRQGPAEHTGNKLDLLIEGEGFFTLKDPLGDPLPLYTRAGAFHKDKDGMLVNLDNLQIQGSMFDSVTGVFGEPGPIDLSKIISPAKATTEVKSTLNLFDGGADPVTRLNGAEPTNTGTINQESILINGVKISEFADIDVTTDLSALINAINEQTVATGVSADENDTGVLKLTNERGGPIVVFLDPSDPDLSDKTGLRSGTTQSAGGSVLTGTVTISDKGEQHLRGSGTTYTTELNPGDILVFGGKDYVVQSIESDTELTVTENIDEDTATALGGNTVNAAVRGSTFSTPVTVFDSLGSSHNVNMRFVKMAPVVTTEIVDPADPTQDITTIKNQWAWSAVVGKNDNGNFDATGVPFDQVQATGVMTFGSDGLLDPNELVTQLFTTDGFDFIGDNPGQDQQINFNFLGNKADFSDGVTQFAKTRSAVIKMTQDGIPDGVLMANTVTSDAQGILHGIFTNGTTQKLAQLLLTTFPNEDGLIRVGGNNYIQSMESGEPVSGGVGIGTGTGTIIAGALEGSNVDLTKQFVKLITYQRGFQANSKVIVTSDEMIQEIVNLKR